MSTKLLKKGLLPRLTIFFIIASFIISGNAVKSFAGTGNLRPKANRNSSRASELRSSLDVVSIGKGFSKIDKVGNKDGGNVDQAKGQDPFRNILGDYSVSQSIDELPYGTFIKNEIDLAKSSPAVKTNLAMNFGVIQDTDRFYTLEIKGIPLALVKKDKEGILSVKKISDTFSAIPMKALTEMPSQFTSQGLDAADVLINDFIFFEQRASVPIPERMTIEFRELLNYVYEIAKEVGEKKAIEMGAALIDTTPDKLASIFRKLGREDAKVKGLELAGGKGLSLSVMAKIVAVPAGLNVTTTAYFKFVRENRKVWEKIFNELRVLDTMDDQRRDTVTEEIRKVIKDAAIPEDIKHEIVAMYRQLNVLAFLSGKTTPTPVAVRSSGTKEDIHITTFLPVSTGSQAGQSDTFLNVRGESKVLEKTRADFASLFTDRAVSYRDDATFLLWSGSIGFKDKTSQTVYFDIVAKLREYAVKLNKPEYKLYADSMSRVTSPNPGSVNLMNALEDILKQEDNPEIANALKMFKEKSQEVVHPEQIGIDVVIMQMVKSHFAGVIFTVNPATKMAGVAQALYKAWFENDDSLVYRDAETGKITGTKPIVVSFDIAYGYGENVVGGTVNPDKFIMATYDGKKWIVLEKNKGNKLIQMIDVEEAIKYLGDEIPRDKALEMFAKVKKDALIYLQKWMKEGDIRVTNQEGDPLAYDAVVAVLEAPDAMLDLKKELVIRWLGKTVGEAISYDEVGKSINGILAKDLYGIKYLQPDPKKPDEKDKDKKERLQKLANDIADKVKNKESEAEVIKFIKDNFYVSSQKGQKGVQENILPQVTNKIFARVQEAAQETERGMRNLAVVLGNLQKADSLRWTVKEVWENKEYRKPQERQEVLAGLGLGVDKQKNLSYLLRSLINNSLTANYETTPEHQNEFTVTDGIAERICHMAWSIANFYKDKRDIEFAIEVDPTVSAEERLGIFLRDKFGKLWGIDDTGKAVMVDETNIGTLKKTPMKLYNVQARPYTAEYLKVDVVRARTEVDEKYLEEKNPKPIASGTKGENATHAYVIVYDSNKGVPWHADLIRRLQSGIFTDEEKEQIRKAGLNPDDYGEGKDQRLPIALNLLEADPNHDPIMRLVAAVVTTRGGDTCHAAIFCREQGIPAVTGTGKVILKDRLIQTGDFLTVDANNGKIYEMDPDPAKRIPIIFVKFKIKPYAIPGDDDGMEFPKIGQIIAATSAAQQNSPIMLAVDADGNALTRAEFKGEEIGVNVFAGYGHYLIQQIKAGKMKKPSRIYAADLAGAKLEGSADFYMALSSEIYKYMAGHPSAWKAFVDTFGHEPGVEDSVALLTAYDLKRDLDLNQIESETLTPSQARAVSFIKKLNQADQDFFEYTFGVFQRRYNYDYNIITDLENHPWILQEVDSKLKEKGYKTFSEYVRSEFLYFYNLMGFTIAPTQTAKNRAYDFAQDKVRGMPGSEVFSWPGVNPLVGLRGSALEIEAVGDDFSGNQLVLDFLFDSVIESNENTHNQAWFYVFVRSTREVDVLDKIIERKAKEKGKLPKQIGIMIEVPSDAMLAGKLALKLKEMEEKYKKYGVQYTFFSFGTNDYSHLAGKGDREDPRMKLEILDPAAKQAIEEIKKVGFYYDDANKKLPLIDEGADVMIQLMEAVVKHADDARVVTSLCGEAITALVNRGAYEIAGRIMSLLKSFGVSMMKVRLAASMTRYDTMAATKELAVPETERKVLFDLSSGEVRQKSGVIKGEVIYIEKAEDLLPEGLKDLRGEELKKKREELKLQSLASAQSTVRTYNKIVVISRNFASQEKEGLVAALGQDLFARLTKEGLLKEIASGIYIWTNLDLDAEKLVKELGKLGLSEAETKTATITWKEAWDNSIDGLERLGIDWDDLQYAKAIIVDADVNLEGWNVFRKDKSINAARIKAVVKGIGALRHGMEGKTVTIDYGAKKIYEGNLAVRKIKSELRDLPIPKVRPEVPVFNAMAIDANNAYGNLRYHPLVILAYERGELDSLAKIFDEYVSKLAEEVEKVTQEGNEAKRIWLLNNLRQKVGGLTDPLIKDFMTNLIDQVLKGKTITLKKGWVDELRAEYFTGLKTGIKELLGVKTAEQFIADAFKQEMQNVLAQNPKALVVYKPTSLNCVQLNNMEAGFLKEQVNPNPDYGLLGAARAIGDMWEINRMELKAFKQVWEALPVSARKNFALQITELRGTQSGAVVIGWKYILKDMDIIPGRDGLMVGVNIATPSDTLAVDKYFEYFNDLGTGLSFVSGDVFKIGAAWAGVDIYWNEWRRLAREEELLELGETASLIVAGKIDKWNKDNKNTPKKIVVFSDEGDNNIGNNAVPAFADAATTTLPIASTAMRPLAVTAAPLMLMDGGLLDRFRKSSVEDQGREAAELLGVQPPKGIPLHYLIAGVGKALTDTPEFKPRAFRLGKYKGVDSFFFQDQDNEAMTVVCVWDKDGTIQFNIDKNKKLLENLIEQMKQAGLSAQIPIVLEASIKIEFSKKDGGEINTFAAIDEIAKSIEPALRSAAKQRMDALVTGGMDRERATIYAVNLVSQQYSPELKVEPGVIALAKGMALKLTQEQDISPSAALFNSLVSLQAREIAASGKMPVHSALRNSLDGGAVVAAPVALFAESTFVGDAAKGSDVGRVIRLGKVMEEGIKRALLGHSANRKAYIKEVSAQIAEGLRITDMEANAVLASARKIAFGRYDTIMNHRILAMLKAGVKEICLCVGSDKDKLTVEEEISDVIEQLDLSFADITLEQIKDASFYVAWEPAANIGTGTAVGAEKIRLVHQAIYKWFAERYNSPTENIDEVWGKSLKILYGASVDGKNVDEIMAVKGDNGIALVHGVLFASSGKKVDGFLVVAEGVNRAAIRDNAQYVCFVNLKQFTRAEKSSAGDYIAEIKRFIAIGKINPANTILAITDQDVHLKEWQDAIAGKAAVAALDGGRQVLSMDKLGQTMQEKNIDALLMVFDLNVKVKGTKVEDDERIVNIVPTVKKAYNELPAQDMYILTSKGRPDGKVVAEESLDPVYDHAEKLFAEVGITNVIYTRLPYDLSEAARIRVQVSADNPDKIRVFEFMNTRYYPQEESADIEARKLWQDQVFAVMGKSPEKVAVIGDYFDKIQRGEHASVEIVRRIPQALRSGGLDLQEKIDKAMLFKERAKGVFFAIAGGKKFDKYKQLGLLAKKAQVTGGRLAIIGALADPYLRSMGIEIGKSLMPKDSEMKDVSKGLEKITKSKVDVMYPLDFIAEGQAKPQETLASDMLQTDIGPKTIKQMVDYIQKLQPGDGLVLNGGAGIFERKEASEGTIQLLMAASEAADRAVAVALAGGDMVKAAKELKAQVEKRLGKPMSEKLIIISGGGALLEVLAKEIDELPAADALLEPEAAASTAVAADGGRAIVTDMARNLGVKEAELMSFVKNEVEAFETMQGSYDFGLLVRRMDSISQAAELSKDQHPTLILSSNLFKRAAASPFINELLAADELRLVIYGPKADQLKILLNNQNIITAGDLAAAREEIIGFDHSHTVLLVTEEDNQEEITKYGSDLLQVSLPKDMPVNLALAKAVEGAVNNKQATEVLADYLAGLENSVIVEQPAPSRQAMLAELEQGIPFEFPGTVKATDEVIQLVEKTEQERADFMGKL